LEFVAPVVYPALQTLPIVGDDALVSQYKLGVREDYRETDRLPKVVVEYAPA
jgi:hypothetical protein